MADERQELGNLAQQAKSTFRQDGGILTAENTVPAKCSLVQKGSATQQNSQVVSWNARTEEDSL